MFQTSASNSLPLLDEESLPSPSIEEQLIPTVPTWTILDEALRTDSRTLCDGMGHTYTVKYPWVDGVTFTWRCTVRGGEDECKGIVIQRQENFKIKTAHRGRCAPRLNLLANLKLNIDLKEEAVRQRFQSGNKVAEELLLKFSDDNPKTKLPKLDNMSSIVRRKKRSCFPDPPKNINFTYTADDFPAGFLQGDFWVPADEPDDDDEEEEEQDDARMLLFATETSAKTLFCDGTFGIIRDPFMQMFGIHCCIRKGNNVKLIPVLFVAMSRRREVDYAKLLLEIQNMLRKRRLRLNVNKIIADFERPFGKAVKKEFGDSVTMHGCAFHWTQCLFKKIKELGLTSQYRKDRETRKFCRLLLSLHFLPSDQISAVFNRFHEQARGRLLKFCTYIYKNWIMSKIWPPENWSSFMEAMRTNNLTEGYHNRLKAKHVTQLDIYRLADLLFYESRIVTLNIQFLSQSQILQHQHTKDKTLSKRPFWSLGSI